MPANDLTQLQAEAEGKIAIADGDTLEALRVSLLGKNGAITAELKTLGGMDPQARKARGAELNVLKNVITDALAGRRAVLDAAALEAKLAAERIDISAPPRPEAQGAIHPTSR